MLREQSSLPPILAGGRRRSRTPGSPRDRFGSRGSTGWPSRRRARPSLPKSHGDHQTRSQLLGTVTVQRLSGGSRQDRAAVPRCPGRRGIWIRTGPGGRGRRPRRPVCCEERRFVPGDLPQTNLCLPEDQRAGPRAGRAAVEDRCLSRDGRRRRPGCRGRRESRRGLQRRAPDLFGSRIADGHGSPDERAGSGRVLEVDQTQ